MSKVRIEVVYAIDMEIGDVPYAVIEAALKENEAEFNVWDLPGTAVLEAVTIAPTK